MKRISDHAFAHRRQRGAVILTAALVLLFLLGFIGIAIDFGHLFVVKTELQTAMDSCALAAAQELDGQAGARDRGRSAGMSAGNLNRVNMQSATWSGQGKIVIADISFRDAGYAAATSDANARYAECQHTQPNVAMQLMQAIGAFGGDTAGNPNTRSVWASAVATRGSAQSTCPIPVALKPKAGFGPPDYGFQVGEWVTVYGVKTPNSGELGWYNLDGTTSANEAKAEMERGYCGTKPASRLGTPGAKTSVDVVWNYRFGIYKNGDYNPSLHNPDFTGYSYTSTNWKNAVPQNAFSGTPAPGSHPSAANYVTKRGAFASFDNTGIDLKNGSLVTFGDKNQLNSFKSLATPGAGGQHHSNGYSRRLVVIPVIDAGRYVIDFACMLMLHPLSGPNDDGHLEYLGNAGNTSGPCVASGLAGGTAGPLVPVLVR